MYPWITIISLVLYILILGFIFQHQKNKIIEKLPKECEEKIYVQLFEPFKLLKPITLSQKFQTSPYKKHLEKFEVFLKKFRWIYIISTLLVILILIVETIFIFQNLY